MNNKIKEVRYRDCPELRMDEDSKSLKGYAAVYDEYDMGEFVERVSPGAFTKTIKEADVRMLWNHNSDIILGRNKANTLTLSEDEHGLKIDCRTSENSSIARDCVDAVRRGDVSQMSIGFYTIKDEWEKREDEKPLRTLKEIQLFDVSPVTFPASPDTTISLRTILENSNEKLEDFEYINKEVIETLCNKSKEKEQLLHAEDCQCSCDGKPVQENCSPLKLRKRQIKIMEINNEY